MLCLLHLAARKSCAEWHPWTARDKERAKIPTLAFIFKTTQLFSCQLALLPCPIFGSYVASNAEVAKGNPSTHCRKSRFDRHQEKKLKL